MTHVFISGSKEYFAENNIDETQKKDLKKVLDILNDDKFEGVVFAVKIEARKDNMIDLRTMSTTINTKTEEVLMCIEKINLMIAQLLTDIEKSYHDNQRC